jgi:hypothetical protein
VKTWNPNPNKRPSKVKNLRKIKIKNETVAREYNRKKVM